MTDHAPPKGRIIELDALRGIAAVGVVFWHYGAHFDAHPLGQLLYPFYNAGFLLVDFFFVLSGFVIARAYWKESRRSSLLRNIWSRIARLYPLHFAMLLVTAVLLLGLPGTASNPAFVQPANDARHFLLNLFLANQIGLQDGWSFNTPAWSISTEFVVNVVFLSWIAMSARLRQWASAAAIVAGVTYFVWMRPPVIEGQTAFGFLDVNLLRCFLGFGAGVAVYLVLDRANGARALRRAPVLCEVASLLSLTAMVILLANSGRHPPISDYIGSIAIAMGCVTFVPFARATGKVLGTRPLVWLGDISYSIYLVHYPMQLALYAMAATWLKTPWDSAVVLLAYLLATVLAAALTNHWLELPGQRRLLAFTRSRTLQQA